MKKLTTILVVVGAFGLLAFVLMNNKKKNQEATDIVSQKTTEVAVKVDTIKTQKSTLSYSANGNFVAAQELNFAAENSGRVTRILVEEGDQVRAGQTLAIIKGDRLQADYSSAQAAYNTAVSDLNRYESAFKTGGITAQQLDQARLQVASAKARLQSSGSSLGDATIKSSINGIINKKYIELGAVVNPGTQLFEIVDISKLKIAVTVPERTVARLSKGTQVAITASAFPDKKWDGKVTFIAPKADASLNFPVEIEVLSKGDNSLKAGMYGTATFTAAESEARDVKYVSRSAFVGGVNANKVFVVRNGVAKLIDIVGGAVEGDRVEVLSGLNDGDIVVTSGQINLVDGIKVKIIK